LLIIGRNDYGDSCRDRTNIENVKTAIANIGFDADDVTAEPSAYQKLPKCCKKPEDGGGPEKKN
jgi:hypothetical protein